MKKGLYSDPRYDAVGSSSLREELFNTYIKGFGGARNGREETSAREPQGKESREARRERALREREQKVKVEQSKLSLTIEKTRTGVNIEEGERVFKCVSFNWFLRSVKPQRFNRTMLVDAIRDPQVSHQSLALGGPITRDRLQTTWDDAVSQLKIDPRFVNSPLPENHQIRLFHAHLTHLRSRHLSALHATFEEKTPSLASTFGDLPVDELISSPHVAKLGYDIRQLEDEFSRWQRQRFTDSRQAFDEMLNENSFVEFWGRLSKMSDVKLDQGLQITNEDIDDDEVTNKIDMKTLAKTVDIGEMVKVLRVSLILPDLWPP